jgi:simple sugar transport system permease protein
MYFYLKYSKQGYEISVVGESERTARYVGIKVENVIVRTMGISGALCGLIGFLLVSGSGHTITTTLSDGRGFTGVMVAWMAKFNPILMILTSFLIAFMSNGAQEIASTFSLNHSFSDILTGIIIFFLIGCEFFISYKLHFRGSGHNTGADKDVPEASPDSVTTGTSDGQDSENSKEKREDSANV